MLTSKQFLQAVEDFLAQNEEWTATRFGKEVMKDGNFVFQLRKGRKVNVDAAANVLAFIKKHSREVA